MGEAEVRVQNAKIHLRADDRAPRDPKQEVGRMARAKRMGHPGVGVSRETFPKYVGGTKKTGLVRVMAAIAGGRVPEIFIVPETYGDTVERTPPCRPVQPVEFHHIPLKGGPG